MSFTCGKHGWQHLLNPCPSCSPALTATGNAGMSNQSKPREFKVGLHDGRAVKAWDASEALEVIKCYPANEHVNVVELAALESANARIEKLREALEFYASKESTFPAGMESDCEQYWGDVGDKARAALSDDKESE